MILFLNWNFLLIFVFFCGFFPLDFGNCDGLKSINICWSHKVFVWIRQTGSEMCELPHCSANCQTTKELCMHRNFVLKLINWIKPSKQQKIVYAIRRIKKVLTYRAAMTGTEYYVILHVSINQFPYVLTYSAKSDCHGTCDGSRTK